MIQIDTSAKQLPIILMPLTKSEVKELKESPFVLDDIYVVSGDNPDQLHIGMLSEMEQQNPAQHQWYFYNGEKYLNDKTIEKYFDRPFFRVMPTVDCEIEDCEPIGKSKKSTTTLFEIVNRKESSLEKNKVLMK